MMYRFHYREKSKEKVRCHAEALETYVRGPLRSSFDEAQDDTPT
jgi:hypothetical protein